jgi:selenocysteine lyase/cysteine desulfurase
MFWNRSLSDSQLTNATDRKYFSYLSSSDHYLDSGCQTLRPDSVIAAETEYYTKYNACGHRVKYPWGEKVDSKVGEARSELLKLVGKTDKDYSVAFSLNATSSINLVLQQLNPDSFNQVITSEIEHSSVFLPTMTFATRHNKPRLVLARSEAGDLIYDKAQFDKPIVLVNTTSNFDGRVLNNLSQLTKEVHEAGGIVLLDGCQTMGHNPQMLCDIEWDGVFGSGHKMYGPSIGFGILKKDLIKSLDTFIIGGSTISDNDLDSYQLIDDGEEMEARLEPGLQNFAGIIGLGEAIKWRNKATFTSINDPNKQLNSTKYEHELTQYLHQKLSQLSGINLLTTPNSPVVSIYSDKIPAHQLLFYTAQKNIMCRTGYHCVYYYLKHKMDYPQTFRISLGLHNTKSDIDIAIETIQFVLKNYS